MKHAISRRVSIVVDLLHTLASQLALLGLKTTDQIECTPCVLENDQLWDLRHCLLALLVYKPKERSSKNRNRKSPPPSQPPSVMSLFLWRCEPITYWIRGWWSTTRATTTAQSVVESFPSPKVPWPLDATNGNCHQALDVQSQLRNTIDILETIANHEIEKTNKQMNEQKLPMTKTKTPTLSSDFDS